MELPPTLPNKLVDDKKYIGPIIEEYIWYPEVPRVDDDAVHSAVVRNVPAELIVAPGQVEPHAGGQQLVLFILVEYHLVYLIPVIYPALYTTLTKSTICCRVTPKVMVIGEDSLSTGLFWGL